MNHEIEASKNSVVDVSTIKGRAQVAHSLKEMDIGFDMRDDLETCQAGSNPIASRPTLISEGGPKYENSGTFRLCSIYL